MGIEKLPPTHLTLFLHEINSRIVECRKCPRLCAWREQVGREKRKAFTNETYWAKAVPNFGDPNATKLIIGLAPAAHGANRTGRMFTGDKSGDWLFRALHKAGVCNKPHAENIHDGLALSEVLITAAVHCAPPQNKPLNTEIANCRPFLIEILQSRLWESILCLGGLSWTQTFRVMATIDDPIPRQKFGHLARCRSKSGTLVVGCFHPSQQNTFTGKLTEEMLDEAIKTWLHPAP